MKENEFKFTIPLNPTTKKNSQQIITRGRHPRLIQSARYRKYADDCGYFINFPYKAIEYPVNIKALYYRGSRHRVDLSNLNAALHDILVKYGVIKDDCCSIVISSDGSRVYYDKENPRTEIHITPSEETPDF